MTLVTTAIKCISNPRTSQNLPALPWKCLPIRDKRRFHPRVDYLPAWQNSFLESLKPLPLSRISASSPALHGAIERDGVLRSVGFPVIFPLNITASRRRTEFSFFTKTSSILGLSLENCSLYHKSAFVALGGRELHLEENSWTSHHVLPAPLGSVGDAAENLSCTQWDLKSKSDMYRLRLILVHSGESKCGSPSDIPLEYCESLDYADIPQPPPITVLALYIRISKVCFSSLIENNLGRRSLYKVLIEQRPSMAPMKSKPTS